MVISDICLISLEVEGLLARGLEGGGNYGGREVELRVLVGVILFIVVVVAFPSLDCFSANSHHVEFGRELLEGRGVD